MDHNDQSVTTSIATLNRLREKRGEPPAVSR